MARSSIVIHNAVMSDEMQREALQCALLAVNMYQNASGIATYIAKEFDRKYQRTWHSVVGNTFSSYVQHTSNSYMFFSVSDKNILLFKTG
ncbi:hypothetical protein cypCar_00045245 [Cyprinus carpio]|nr:hypothetical protein cypCar_00045245 [Cyprinus carpio]